MYGLFGFGLGIVKQTLILGLLPGQAAAAAHSCAIFVLLRRGDLKYSPPRIAGAFVVSPSRLWYTY